MSCFKVVDMGARIVSKQFTVIITPDEVLLNCKQTCPFSPS